MATLTVETIVEAGLNATYNAAAGGGDEFVNNGEIVLHVKNANGASARQVTVDAPTTCNRGSTHDSVVSVPLSSDRFIGPFPTAYYNDADGKCQITYDNAADVTVAVLKVPKS
jgi:hypothetical protein